MLNAHVGRVWLILAMLAGINFKAQAGGNKRAPLRIFAEDAQTPRKHVYFFVGGPIDDRAESMIHAVRVFVEALKKADPEIEFKRLHNTQWNNLCEEIKRSEAPFDSTKGEAMVLVGHSWGGQAVVDFANCLESSGFVFPLAMTADPSPKLGHPDPNVVPENILTNHNYTQDADWLWDGSDNFRADGSLRGITNTYVKPSFSFNPHRQLIVDLLKTPSFQDRVIEVFKKSAP